MAKFSVCRIYKVTLWLNFSYNYSVNLLQILHLYIHPWFGVDSKKKDFLNSRISLSFLHIWNWNNKDADTLPLFPRKPYPIPDQNGHSLYPFLDQNGAKTGA